MNLRLLCFNILKKVEEGSFIQSELKIIEGLESRDAAFATRLVKGVIRNRLKLEHRLSAASDRPIQEIDPDTKLFLLIGSYQLTEMDGVPAYAAVNETVKAMKSLRMHKTSSFVNGVLRNLSRKAPEALQYSNDLERMSVEYSMPRWMVERWSDQYSGALLENILKEMINEPLTSIFINRNKILKDELIEELSKEGVECGENEFFDDMLSVKSGRASDTSAFRKGCFYIQDPASRLVSKIVSLLADESGSMILDAAAAPGGKSINLLCDGFDVLSGDINHSKLLMMRDNMRRMDLNEGQLAVLDAQKPLPFSRRFRVVLLDAPCSACGRIRRSPEIKYRLEPEDFDFLAAQQLKILSNLAGWVEDAGYLVYSTCSIDKSEDEGVVEKFLSAHPEYALIDPKSFSAQLPLRDEITNTQCFIRTDSHMGKMDGFFVAVMKKAAGGLYLA